MRSTSTFVRVLVVAILGFVPVIFAPNGQVATEPPREEWEEIIGRDEPVNLEITLENDHKTVLCNGQKVAHNHSDVHSIVTISSGELYINGEQVAVPKKTLKKVSSSIKIHRPEVTPVRCIIQ